MNLSADQLEEVKELIKDQGFVHVEADKEHVNQIARAVDAQVMSWPNIDKIIFYRDDMTDEQTTQFNAQVRKYDQLQSQNGQRAVTQ